MTRDPVVFHRPSATGFCVLCRVYSAYTRPEYTGCLGIACLYTPTPLLHCYIIIILLAILIISVTPDIQRSLRAPSVSPHNNNDNNNCTSTTTITITGVHVGRPKKKPAPPPCHHSLHHDLNHNFFNFKCYLTIY